MTVLAFEAGSSNAFARARVTRFGGESGISAVFLRFCAGAMGGGSICSEFMFRESLGWDCDSVVVYC